MNGLIQRRTNMHFLMSLMRLAVNAEAGMEVRSIASDYIERIDSWLSVRTQREPDGNWRALHVEARQLISRFRDDATFLEQVAPVVVPPGSPIGSAPIF